MDNYLFTIEAAVKPAHSNGSSKGRKVHSKITAGQDTSPILALLLVIFALVALVAFPPGAMSASCGMECCKNCNIQKCCKDDCKSDTRSEGDDKGQPRQGQQYEDIKCFNVCMESGYTCEHCENACSYHK